MTVKEALIDVWPEGAEELGIPRSLSQAQRDKIDDGDFAGPHSSFPIDSQEHLDAAAHLIGHADDPAAVKAKAIRIAKRKGFKLPAAWEEDSGDGKKDDGERAMQGTEQTRVISADHEPMTATHTHAHPAFGAQGDDDNHSHEHTHDNDADHKHSHDDTAQERAHTHDATAPAAIQTTDRHVMSLPFVRIDAAKREVWGQATAEIPDSYGTIFGYYPEAWKTWRGNIREQHDPKKAVGKRVELDCNDQERAIYVGSRVSRGAQDTWLKVEDDVLAGYSASIIPDPEFGNDIRKWPRKEYKGKEYPYLPRYTVAELSLVDNPACPGCDIQIVRADGFATDVLDLTEDEPPAEQKTLERAGARVGKGTQDANHKAIGHTLHAAVAQMQNCKADCPQCAAAMKMIDPDGDGDVDLGGYDDPDGDWQSLYNGKQQDMERVITELIERSLQPVYSRLQGIAGTLARSNGSATPMNIEQIVTSSITRAFETFESRMAELPTATSMAEVRAELSAVKERVVAIAEQPMPGGPVLNASVMPRPPIEKTLATDPISQPRQSYGAVFDAIQEMAKQGNLDTPEKQTDAAAAFFAAQRRR
jgi:hypothetical protein